MKVSVKPFIILILLVLGVVLANNVSLSPSTAMAQEAGNALVSTVPAVPGVTGAQAEAPPEWLGSAIEIAKSLPYIGPIVVEFFKWLGVITSLLTALTSLLIFLAKLSEKLGKTLVWFDKVSQVLQKLVFLVGYLSVFNVTKDDDGKTKIK